MTSTHSVTKIWLIKSHLHQEGHQLEVVGSIQMIHVVQPDQT